MTTATTQARTTPVATTMTTALPSPVPDATSGDAGTLLNYTPHAINLYVGDLMLLEIPSHGNARLTEERTIVDEIVVDGAAYPIVRASFGEVYGLPDPVPGVRYIVSHPVALWAKLHHPERDDLVVPDDAVRDEHGQPIGARALAHL